jgi:hypothetical protein
MTDSPIAAPDAAPAVAPASVPAVDTLTPDAARAEIETLKGDKSFYDRLMAKDPDASARWAGLHKQGFPSAPPVTPEQMTTQDAARLEQSWSEYFAWIGQRQPLTPEQQAEMRNGKVNADLHAWAAQEKDRLVKDKAFYRKFLDGDRSANRDWQIVTNILSLKPEKDFQWRK